MIAWYNRCAMMLLVLAISAYATASSSPEFAVLAIPAVVALWRLSSRKTGRFLLPRLVVNILLLAVMVFAALRAQAGFNVQTIAEVVVLIQVIKIGDRRQPRDDAQILCMSVFLAIAAMLDSNGMWTGVQLAVFLPLLMMTVMLYQLYQGAVHAGAGTKETPAGRGSSFRRQLRATCGLATIATLGLSLVVFVVLPRGIGANAFGSMGVPQQARQTAFTNSVKLGQQGIISTSSKIVLDLVVRNENGENLGGADLVQYLRGAVLTDYDRMGQWSASIPDRPMRAETQMIPGESFPVGSPVSPMIEQTISLRGTVGKDHWQYLFALWRATRVQFSRPGYLTHDIQAHVLRAKIDAGPLDYSVWSSPIESPRDVDPARTPVQKGSEALRPIASGILQRIGIDPNPETRPQEEDNRAARAIQDYLRTNFTYTLEQESPPGDQDPIEYFLLERKKGHCEYFASAMVLLCRSVGINARMVTGYIATEYNESTGAYVVRESNAHAWVEAEDGDHHFKRFDPTPPDDLARLHKPVSGLLGRLQHALEAVEYAWNSSIISFDERARQRLLGPSRGEQAGWLGRVDRVSQRVRNGGGKLMLSALISGVSVFLAVASAGLVLSWLARNIRIRRRGSTPMTALTVATRTDSRLYAQLLRVLARRGLAKPKWRPPLEHAAALAAVSAPLGEDVRRLVDSYYRERFGGHPLQSGERKSLLELVRRVKRFRPGR
jgi:hypothetical protein